MKIKLNPRSLIRLVLLCGLVLLAGIFVFNLPAVPEPVEAGPAFPYHVFLPLLTGSSCDNLAGESYAAIFVIPPPTNRPAEQHADLNLALRGYSRTTGTLGLVDYGGPTDGKAPKLNTLFADRRVPAFPSVSRVNNWDWDCNCRADPITYPAVTLIGMSVTPGEPLRVPTSQYNIGSRLVRPERGVFEDRKEGDPNSYEVLVLYASPERITLKYTREDNVVKGYTVHIENVCVAPDLLALYQQWNTAGRAQLPALKAGQAFGRARSDEIGVVIRDSGSFMDPRSGKDWW